MANNFSVNNKKLLRATLIGLFINGLLTLIKCLAGIFGNSFALIADATESGIDIFSSLVLWTGMRIAVKAPDKDHPYGHGKAEPLSAVFVGLFMILIAIAIGVESIHKIITPHALPEQFTLYILPVVILIKEVLYRYVIKISSEHKSTASKTDAWHHRGDAITSFAAFIGILIARIGGKGYENADDYAALFACLVIVFTAIRIMAPAINEVMDAAGSEWMIEDIRRISGKNSHVRDTEKCNVRKMGLHYYVDLHIEVDPGLTVEQGHEIAHQVKDAIFQEHPSVIDVMIHVEPYYPKNEN